MVTKFAGRHRDMEMFSSTYHQLTFAIGYRRIPLTKSRFTGDLRPRHFNERSQTLLCVPDFYIKGRYISVTYINLQYIHWKPRVVIMPSTLSFLTTPDVAFMTPSSATSNEKLVSWRLWVFSGPKNIHTILLFCCSRVVNSYRRFTWRVYPYIFQGFCSTLEPSHDCPSASEVIMKYMGTMDHFHVDVIKWNHFPRYWSFARGIHRSPVNSPHKGQWRGALRFSLICALNKRLNRELVIWEAIALIMTSL